MNDAIATSDRQVTFDVGGTTVRAGLFENGALVEVKKARTPSTWTSPGATASEIRAGLFRTLAGIVEDLCGDGVVPSITVAFPGPLFSSGEVASAATIWGDRDSNRFPLQAALAELWPHSDVAVLNDVTAAGWYYAQQYGDFLIVTVSSGIGSKLFIGGRPVLGHHGIAGEIGHVRVDPAPDALSCECGGRGHLAAVASGRSAYRLFASSGKASAPANAAEDDPIRQFNTNLFSRVKAGDEVAIELLDQLATPLGQALALLQAITDVRVVLIMGGFALAGGQLYRKLIVDAAQATGVSGLDWEAIVRLAYAPYAALYGCMYSRVREAGSRQ